MDWINEAIKLYATDTDGMKKGKEIESKAIEGREKFISIYPIERIPHLTIEQYASGTNSFSYWLHNKLNNIANIKSVSKNHFEVYTRENTSSQIHLSRSYKKDFGSDYKKAFNFLKEEIVSFLKDIEQKKYNNFEKYKIDSILKNMLMVVYFYDRFVPVCVKPKINKCLNNLNISFAEDATMVEKNLDLVKWKKTVPASADWSNQMVLDFGDRWLNAKAIEEVQKIEKEIASLSVEEESQKALVNVRVNQRIFRGYLLNRYNKCCLCDMGNSELLIASHIKPWAECERNEKLDVDNGFLMCPNHDKLFDKGYITFDDDGKIKISDKLAENDKELLNVNSKMHIELTNGNKKYLKFHQENIYIK